MSLSTRIARATCVVMFCVSLTGCIDFPVYCMEPVEVQVLDAETEKPIARATISIMYGHPEMIIFNMPDGTAGETDQDGAVELIVADFDYGSRWEVNADGYLTSWLYARDDERVPEEIREAGTHGVEQAVIRLYREPRPVIMFVAPNDYRGLIKLEWKPTASFVIGQREFLVDVTDDGHARLDAPPMLHSGNPYWTYPDFQARYVDGAPIRQPKQLYDDDSAVAVWKIGWLALDDSGLWLIGSRTEYDQYSRELHQDGRVDEEAVRRIWER